MGAEFVRIINGNLIAKSVQVARMDNVNVTAKSVVGGHFSKALSVRQWPTQDTKDTTYGASSICFRISRPHVIRRRRRPP